MKGVISFLFILALVGHSLAQSNADKGVVVKKYTYVFTSASDQQQLDKLEAALYQIKGITEVKVSYKWDSGNGLLYFSHSSYVNPGELASEFNPADVKKLILELGLIPVEFTEL